MRDYSMSHGYDYWWPTTSFWLPPPPARERVTLYPTFEEMTAWKEASDLVEPFKIGDQWVWLDEWCWDDVLQVRVILATAEEAVAAEEFHRDLARSRERRRLEQRLENVEREAGAIRVQLQMLT